MPPAPDGNHVHVAEIFSLTRFPARVVCKVVQSRRHVNPEFSCEFTQVIATDIAIHASQRVFGHNEALA